MRNSNFLEALVVASEEIGLYVNSEKTKYMVTSREQNVGRSHRIKIDNSSFEISDILEQP
jgi:hypothetical protein